MDQHSVLKGALLPGAAAGLTGGLLLAIVTIQLGQIVTVGSVLTAESPFINLLIDIIASLIIGAGFGLLVWRQHHGAGETLFWGLTYGLVWWIIGPLTLVPLVNGSGLGWDLTTAQHNIPSLIGYLLLGATIGLALALFRRDWRTAHVPLLGPLLRGAVAGLLAAWLLSTLLDIQDQLMAMNAMLPNMMTPDSRISALFITLIIGFLAGLLFALLYPAPFDGTGAGLIRGAVYGFLWWVVGARTLIPLLGGDMQAWSLDAIRADFPTLPGYVLFGTLLVLLYLWIRGLSRLLFGTESTFHNQEGVGAQGLRALGRGILAGSIGGLLFSLVMLQIGFLPTVASLVGMNSASAGFFVHLIIANLIGMSYGLFFHRQTYDLGSALAWGTSFGVLWWILGPLTLMPVLLGSPPQWSAAFAAESFAALIGHLVYGAAVGIIVFLLEARYRPWWVSRSKAEENQISRRKDQILTSAPALWLLIVVMALTVPLFLGM
jgi:uncharacterized membrane protein YagU involved in acid resistance